MTKSLIYSRTGDNGTSALLNGERLSKAAPIFDAIGSLDELNCLLGIALAELNDNRELKDVRQNIIWIQKILFSIGAVLADSSSIGNSSIFSEQILKMEQVIDSLDEEVGPLKNFILPGGSKGGAYLHLARSVCRRMERDAIRSEITIPYEIFAFVNRLSDLLFVLARATNFRLNTREKIWRGSSESPFN